MAMEDWTQKQGWCTECYPPHRGTCSGAELEEGKRTGGPSQILLLAAAAGSTHAQERVRELTSAEESPEQHS